MCTFKLFTFYTCFLKESLTRKPSYERSPQEAQLWNSLHVKNETLKILSMHDKKAATGIWKYWPTSQWPESLSTELANFICKYDD